MIVNFRQIEGWISSIRALLEKMPGFRD